MNFTKKLIEAEDIFSCEQNILDIKVWYQLMHKTIIDKYMSKTAKQTL